MLICEQCLMAIESHEGSQVHKHLDCFDRENLPEGTIQEDENGNEFFICEWCEEECDVSEMTEI